MVCCMFELEIKCEDEKQRGWVLSIDENYYICELCKCSSDLATLLTPWRLYDRNNRSTLGRMNCRVDSVKNVNLFCMK